MKKLLILIIVLIMFLSQHAFADPVENDFGVVNAWYNDQEATVENVQLKVGEPAEITVSINSKIDCNVYVELTNPLVTVPYVVINGPSKIDESIDNYGVEAGWEKKYTWIIKPNGEWTQGTAPINIFVQFSDRGDYRTEEFTIANPYILDEHYSGPAPTSTTTDPSSTDQPPSQGSPGFGVVGALLGIALVLLGRRN
ncbi:MAG: sarcinarray family MAST domain-containing protein [Methanosarcinaceae archaeon]|nr:sarcinarray family MAST domain-containing protein [Methanosarcinaceae archaeon]